MVDKDGWRLSAEPNEKLTRRDKTVWLTKSWLAKHASREMPDLQSVDNQLLPAISHARTTRVSPEDICAVLAAVMAHGCNRRHDGAATRTSLTTTKRIGDWQQPRRTAECPGELVNAIADLDTSSRWGEVRTAASAWQRFSVSRSTAPDSATSPWNFTPS
jgi:hypothetical protein